MLQSGLFDFYNLNNSFVRRFVSRILSMETKNSKTEKPFDAIKMMREIRDKMSREIMNMTYEEERAYLDKLLEASKKDTATA